MENVILFIPKLQGCNRWSLGMDQLVLSTFYWQFDQLSLLTLNLNHASESGSGIFKSFFYIKAYKWPITSHIYVVDRHSNAYSKSILALLRESSGEKLFLPLLDLEQFHIFFVMINHAWAIEIIIDVICQVHYQFSMESLLSRSQLISITMLQNNLTTMRLTINLSESCCVALL